MNSSRQSRAAAPPTIRELRSFGALFSLAVLFWTVVGHCSGHWLACADAVRSGTIDLAAIALPNRTGLVTGALLMGLALAQPRALTPLYHLMQRLGRALHQLISWTVLAALFFLVITPMGAFGRLLRKDPLRLRFDAAAPSYWVDRNDDGETLERFRDPF